MNINPERLDFVRQRLLLNKSEFAERLEVDRKTLQRIYKLECDASDEIVARLISFSGYSKEFFHKSDPVLPNANGVSFRSLRSLTAKSRDAALAAAGLAFEFDEWVRKQFALPEHDLPQLVDYGPREAARALRAQWGIGVRPIGNMINILESHGVRVFSLVEETRHLDAYAYWHDDAPYVFLNTCKTGEHSRFDAAHELGHLVMHRHSGTAKRDAEFEANTFASEFLMPQADLIAEWTQRRLYTVADLSKAKQRWGVSVAALNYALHSAGLLTEWQKNTNFIELSRRGRSNEPNPIQHETSQIWAKILSAFWKRGMSLSHIANELCIPETELSRLLFNVAAPARLPERQAPKLTLVS